MDGVVIVAAGLGERLGAGQPKALVPVGGRALLLHSLDTLLALPDIQAVVVGPPDHLPAVRALVPPQVHVVAGGATRQESVQRGVEALDPHVDAVLVHDAARPLLTRTLASAVRAAIHEHGAAAAVVAVTDTLHRQEPGGGLAPGVPRAGLLRAQTPQGARRSILLPALQAAQRANGRWTDEAALLIARGIVVRAVEGDEANLKITSVQDLRMAEALLAAARQGGSRA